MLETLISSKTRIKLLMRLFLNPESSAHLRGLAGDFGESTNAVRVELNRFEDAGMLVSESKGNKKIYKANHTHPLFSDINSIILKYIGLDKVTEMVIGKLGELEKIYLTGDYAEGKDSGIIDLVLIGDINTKFLLNIIEKAEKLINKKIRFITYSLKDWEAKNTRNDKKELLLWGNSL